MNDLERRLLAYCKADVELERQMSSLILDTLQCDRCGVYYVPEQTVTGRTVPHCIRLPQHQLSYVVGSSFPYLGKIIDMEV